MATSGSYTFDPTFAATLDEACERAGIDPQHITQRHIKSAKTSLNLMLIEWAADTDSLYRLASSTASVTSGTDNFTAATGTIDVLDVVMDYEGNGEYMPLNPISRQDYLNLVDPTEDGAPKSYYVDVSTLNTPKVYLYPVPDQTVAIKYDYMRYAHTVTALSETLDVQRLWLDALHAGLALRLAEKYNIARVAYLKTAYREAYLNAKQAGQGNSQVIISGRAFGRTRTARL